MNVRVLTGGIATGKSTVCELIRKSVAGAVVFDADAVVRALLDGDPGIARQISADFGNDSLAPDGSVNRRYLRERIFSDPGERRRLEAILHPRVRQECLAMRGDAGKRSARWFVADIPLFFETNFDVGQMGVLVVACSRSTQISRLKARNKFDDVFIDSILSAQLPITEKISRADVVFWNEGPLTVLESQVKRYFRTLP